MRLLVWNVKCHAPQHCLPIHSFIALLLTRWWCLVMLILILDYWCCCCCCCYAAVDVTLRFLASVDHCAYIVFNFLHVIFIDNHLPNRKRMNRATTTTPKHHRRYRIKLSTVGFLRLQFINIHTNIFKCNTTNKREEQRAGTDFDVKTQLHMQTNGRR